MSTTNRNGASQRRRYSDEQMAKRVAEYRRSGLSQEAYAERRGMKVGTLRNWLYRRSPRVAEPIGLAAVEVTVSAPRASAAGGVVILRWPSGVQAEVALGPDVTTAVRVIRELVA